MRTVRTVEPETRRKAMAATATVLFHLIILLVLLTVYLRYTAPGERIWPPEDTSELLLDGEYVRLGDLPSASANAHSSAARQPAAPADDPVNAGPASSDAPSPVTTDIESPMQTPKTDPVKPTGPTKEELEAVDRARKREETSHRVANSLGSGNKSGKTDAAQGSPNGNSSTGAVSSQPGHSLNGRTLAHWDKPKGNAVGTIVVKIAVNRQGNVISASYQSGTGAVAGDPAARRSCEQAAMKSRFSVSEDAPAEQKGTITYRFQ